MSRLILIAILFAVVLYMWWRVKRRIAAFRTKLRGETRQSQPAPERLNLEKDPVTGVYRPPKE